MMQPNYFSFQFYLRKWHALDKQLTSSFITFNVPVRKKTSNGIWLPFILPIALLSGALKYRSNCSSQYWHFALLSTNFLMNAVFGILHFKNKCELPLIQIGGMVSLSTSSLLLNLYSFNGYFNFTHMLHSLVCAMCYPLLLDYLLTTVKHGFTYGEASIVVQTVILFLLHSYTNIFYHVGNPPTQCENIVTLILQTGLICIVCLASLCHVLPAFRHPLPFYLSLLALITFGIIIPLHMILGQSPVMWIIQLVLRDHKTMYVLIYWVACVFFAIAVITTQISSKHKASTALRKYFHILAVFVFIPGMLAAPCLLYLATGIVLALFLLLEIMRLLQLPPLAPVLNQGFAAYVDEKDSLVALTPIYLLAGCSLPLWIAPLPLEKMGLLVLAAGVLSIGIGDTFASVVGSKLGRHKWPNSNRSVEGTIACILSQVGTVLVFAYFELIPWSKIYTGLVGATLVSLIEARTDQIDNLILPLVQYCVFISG